MTQIFDYSIPLPLWLTLMILVIAWVALSFFFSRLFGIFSPCTKAGFVVKLGQKICSDLSGFSPS